MNNKFLDKSLTYLILAALCVAMIFLNIHFNGKQHDKKGQVIKLEGEKNAQQAENNRLSGRNKSISVEVEILKENPNEILAEKMRENFGMVGDNETVFILKSLDSVNAIPDIPGLDVFELVQDTTVLPPEKTIDPDKALPKAE